MPPPLFAELPESVLLVIVTVATLPFKTPPPKPPLAELPESVLLLIVTVPVLRMPPAWKAELPESVLLVIVTVPALLKNAAAGAAGEVTVRNRQAVDGDRDATVDREDAVVAARVAPHRQQVRTGAVDADVRREVGQHARQVNDRRPARCQRRVEGDGAAPGPCWPFWIASRSVQPPGSAVQAPSNVSAIELTTKDGPPVCSTPLTS